MNRDEVLKAIELFQKNLGVCKADLEISIDYGEISQCEYDWIKAQELSITALQAQLNDGWISVEERLPEDGCDVIIAFKWRGGQSNWSEIGRYDELKEEWYNGDCDLREVTHWQPLPQPPKEDKQ